MTVQRGRRIQARRTAALLTWVALAVLAVGRGRLPAPFWAATLAAILGAHRHRTTVPHRRHEGRQLRPVGLRVTLEEEMQGLVGADRGCVGQLHRRGQAVAGEEAALGTVDL